MLPSEVPRLATDSPVRVFPGVWKLLSFLRLPPRDRSPSLTLLSLFIFYILSYLLSKTMGCLSGCLVSCQHSEVVLWNLLSVQMFFWWICGGESGIPILFLCHRRTAPISLFNMLSRWVIAFLSRSIDFFFFNSCQQGGPKIVEE